MAIPVTVFTTTDTVLGVNVLNVTDTSEISVGYILVGYNIPINTLVTGISGNIVTLNNDTTNEVPTGTSMSFYAPYTTVSAQYDLTRLLTRDFKSKAPWKDFATVASLIIQRLVDDNRNALNYIRDIRSIQRGFKILHTQMLGVDNILPTQLGGTNPLADDDYNRMGEFITKFWSESGREDFVNFIGFFTNTRLTLINLISEAPNYTVGEAEGNLFSTLTPSPAGDFSYTQFFPYSLTPNNIFNYPPGSAPSPSSTVYFPTTHVAVGYDPNAVVVVTTDQLRYTEIANSERVVDTLIPRIVGFNTITTSNILTLAEFKILFYKFAPIPLVLQWFAPLVSSNPLPFAWLTGGVGPWQNRPACFLTYQGSATRVTESGATRVSESGATRVTEGS
jgi:hypothetical protein